VEFNDELAVAVAEAVRPLKQDISLYLRFPQESNEIWVASLKWNIASE
jgi:hypothetical protein